MGRFRVIVRSAIAACLLLAVFVGIQPAQAASSVTCDNGFGAKVPVLMVHGFDSNRGMWTGQHSMKNAIDLVEGVQVVTPFDYEKYHFNWITDPNIGPKLAATIDCLAQTSQREGGAGKVVVIAHSMGGLATRYAANQVVNGRRVADELGLVVTLGTPNTGTPWSTYFGSGSRWYCNFLIDNSIPDRSGELKKCENSSAITAMKEGSQELRDLPPFPPSVPVRAIAGQVRVFVQLLYATVVNQQFSDDLAVPVKSATAEYTDTGRGDGRFVFKCDARHYEPYGWNSLQPRFQGGECWHNAMYKTGYIQQSVVNGIQEYLRSVRTPSTPVSSGKPVTFFNNLTLMLPKAATVTPTSGEGPSAYLVACGDASCPSFWVYRPNEVGGSDALGWRQWDISRCSDATGQILQKATLGIGGKAAKYYEAAICKPGQPPVTAGFWEVNDGSIFIMAQSLATGQREMMNSLLATASWK